jgi:DNA invertase Pin-like site-specific DNA recombinase
MAGRSPWVVEPAVSGAVPLAERPEGGKLWNQLRRGDTLVAVKLDRAFRSSSDCLVFRRAGAVRLDHHRQAGRQ